MKDKIHELVVLIEDKGKRHIIGNGKTTLLDHIAPKIRDILKELEGGKDNGIAKTDTRND
jgi:hypothetical protein